MTTATLSPTDQGTASVTVRSWHTDRPGSYRIELTRTGPNPTAVIFHSNGEVAMALNLSGQPVTRATDPVRAAALVLAAVDLVGVDQITDLTRLAREFTLRGVGQLTPIERARWQALWSGRRQQACVDAAARMARAAARGQLGTGR